MWNETPPPASEFGATVAVGATAVRTPPGGRAKMEMSTLVGCCWALGANGDDGVTVTFGAVAGGADRVKLLAGF